MRLFKRGEFYHYQFGVRSVVYRGSTKERTYQKAQRAAMRKQSEVDRGERISGRVPNLAEYAVEFLKWVDGHQSLKSESKRYYGRGVKLLEPLGAMTLDRITPASLETVKFPGGPCTANCALRTLRRMLNRAREDKLLAVVPRIKCRSEEARTMVLDSAAEAKLAPHLPENALDVIRIMRDTGGRNGEVLAMRWEHIDWERGLYAVQGGKTKAAKRRFPPLSLRVLEILNRRHLAQGMPSQGWIFPGKGRTGHLQSINKVFSRARAQAGLPRTLVPYCARHDAGSFLMETTGNPKVVMELMGHRQVSTTMRYTHLREEQVTSLRDAINRR